MTALEFAKNLYVGLAPAPTTDHASLAKRIDAVRHLQDVIDDAFMLPSTGTIVFRHVDGSEFTVTVERRP